MLDAIANIVGGFINKASADSARDMTRDLAMQNMALQREFAQNGIRWKVEDAKAAGIHPIYALGGSGASFSPVSANFSADTSLGNAFAAAGQDLSKSIDRTRTQQEKVSAFTEAAQKLDLEGKSLNNDLLRAELANKTASLRQGAQPPFPAQGDAYVIPGQSNSGLIKNKPLEVAPGPSNQPQSEGGAITDVGYARTSTGWAPVPSNDVKQRIEDNFVQERLWDMRNNILPSFGFNQSPPPFAPPPGKRWYFDVAKQEYQLIGKDERPYNKFLYDDLRRTKRAVQGIGEFYSRGGPY